MSNKGGKRLILMALLCVLGAVLSFISLKQHVALKLGLQSGLSFCNISAAVNCDSVAASQWAELFGFPVAGFGLIYYVLIFVFALVALNSNIVHRYSSAASLLSVSFFGLLYSIYLLIISHFVIGSLCLMCLGMDLVNFALFVLSLSLSRERGFLTSLGLGIKKLIAFLPFVFGAGEATSESRAAARLGFVVAAFLTVTCYFLPNFLAASLKGTIAPSSAAVQKALQAWRAKTQDILTINPATDYSSGPEDAPITVVEFSDYQCPACKMFYSQFEEVLKQYPEKVRFVLKNFPLDNKCNHSVKREFHQFACMFAAFTRCAGEQGKFWETADFVFRLEMAQEVESEGISELLIQGAEVFSLDQHVLQNCLKENRAMPGISSDIEQGLALGIQGTPSLWINGRRLDLPSPENIKAVLQAVFDEILNAKK